MRRALRAYPTLLRIGVAEAVAYRAELVVWMLTMTLPLIMLALWTAVAAEGPIGHWNGRSFTAYYLATLIVRQVTGSWVVWELVREIKEGTLSMRLLRPIHPLLGFSAESLAALPMRALLSLPVAGIALFLLGGKFVTHDPLLLAAFPAAVLGAWMINFCVGAIIGTLGLYLESSLSVWELWLGAFMVLSGYLVPLDLFPHWVERIARLLPFAYLQAVPVEILTGTRTRPQVLSELAAQWAYAAAAFVGMTFFWRRAVARFAAYGG